MNKRAMPLPNKNEIELPGNMNPVLALLGFLPVMIIIMIALALAVENTPIPLMILLVLVCGCCVMLSWTALQVLLGGKLTLGEDSLTVHRFLSETSYPWGAIEGCKVMPATGTFGDDALVELDERAGVGLFLRGLDRRRDHDLDADVVLCAGSRSHLQPLMQIANKVQAGIKRAEAPVRRPPARAPQSGQRQQFRQRRPAARKPAAAQADPVAAFRNRAASK
ncbi:MAG: hypothetical protein ACR2PI_03385 [Hyphomicrobiaceae bacterium]